MLVLGFAFLVFGYAVAYAGMTGFLSLLSGGKIEKESVLQAMGVTGQGGLTQSMSSFALASNPFANAAALNVKSDTVSSSLGITADMAPAAYLMGNGMSNQAPISGTVALGGGGGGSDGSVAA